MDAQEQTSNGSAETVSLNSLKEEFKFYNFYNKQFPKQEIISQSVDPLYDGMLGPENTALKQEQVDKVPAPMFHIRKLQRHAYMQH